MPFVELVSQVFCNWLQGPGTKKNICFKFMVYKQSAEMLGVWKAQTVNSGEQYE